MATKKTKPPKAPALIRLQVERKLPSAEDIVGSAEEVVTQDHNGKPLPERVRVLRLTFRWNQPVMSQAVTTIQAVKPDPGRPFTNKEKVEILHEALLAPSSEGGLGWTLC